MKYLVDSPSVVTTRTDRRPICTFVGLLFLSALLIRFVCLATTYNGEDGISYFEDVEIALNLLEGRGYALDFTRISPTVPVRPTAAKPPLYPFVVALVFSTFGTAQFLALFITHAILSALTCVFLYLSLVKFAHYTAAIAAAMVAVYPPFVYHSVTVPESTTLVLFLISVFFYVLVKVHAMPSARRWISASLISGLLALAEPITIPFIVLSFSYIAYLSQRSFKDSILQLSVVLFVFAVTIAPWTVRNYLVFDELVFFKSSFGASLKDSFGKHVPRETYAPLIKMVEGKNEIEEDNAVRKAILSWILANPLTYMRLLPSHFLNFWWETRRYKDNRTTQYVFGRKFPYVGLLGLSLVPLFLALVRLGWRKLRANIRIDQNLMLILILTYTAIYTIVGAWNMRYHFPVELAMFVFAAETSVHVLNKLGFAVHNSRSIALSAS